MTKKRFLKSLISLALVATLIMSLFAVSFGTVSAAEVDATSTGAATTVYFQNNWKWSDVRIYAWNSSNSALLGSWPGKVMTRVGNDGTYDYYKYTLPEGTAGFIFNGIKDNGSGNRDQSPDMKTIPANNTTFYYMNWNNGNQCLASTTPITNKFPNEGPTTAPTTPTKPTETTNQTETTKPTENVPVEYTKVCFRDDLSDGDFDTEDANMMVSFDGSSKKVMTKTVDAMSGHDMWYADIPAGASSVKFYRTNVIDSTVWNTWSANLSSSVTGLYCATGWGTGNWGSSSQYFAIPDSDDINNLSFGIWADIKGNGNPYDCVVTRKSSSSNNFYLYIPSNTPEKINVYTSFDSLTIGGTKVEDGTAFDFSKASSYDITYKQTKYDSSTKSATLKVYKTENTATLLINTERPLYMGTTTGIAGDYLKYKDAIETKGSIYLYDEEGKLVNSADGATKLKKIKGRGNSSFEASMKIYGKYAYNFNLDKKVAMAKGAVKSKKWCLLANNPDVSMMRNTFMYTLADEVGVKYAPETRLVDTYNNGNYLGAYIITEKVEYGGSTLMDDLESLDDGNEEANIEAYQNEDIMDDLEDHLVQKTSSYTTNGQSYSYQYTTSDDTTNWPYHQPENFKEYNFLLEFELFNRYKNEASWFVSPRTGQAVVVKYPEFATKDEMKWIIEEFEKAESAIYANDTEAIKNAVDVDSFAKMYLIQELALNLDSCATSYYMHNDLESGKLVSSPVWDYDWSLGAYNGVKYVYNGSSISTSSSLDYPKQVFVKNKALQTDSNDGTKKTNYNFQAKLVHNSYAWERCRYIWTNDFVPALSKYIDDDKDTTNEGIMLTQWLPSFSSSVKMNDARWGSLTFTGDTWGTKITSNYVNHSFNFYAGQNTAGSASKTYENTIYYLNDWTATRWGYMSSNMGLYDEALVEKYELKDVNFTAEIDAEDASKLTVTPSATATLNGKAIDAKDVTYTVYVGGKAVCTADFTQKSSVVTLNEGDNEVYVEVSINGKDITEKSESQNFTYVVIPEVNVTLNFKSLASYRYAPTVTVDGKEYAMDKPTLLEGETEEEEAIELAWYSVTVSVKQNVDTEIIFTNECNMSAKATLNLSEDTELYYGCNDLNNGDTLVDLTDLNTPECEYMFNFFKSSDNMLINDVADKALASTIISGIKYVMGDANEDNSLNIMDATTIQRVLVEYTQLNSTTAQLADYNLDQVVSIMDVTEIQLYLAQ